MNMDGVVQPGAAQVSGPFGRTRRSHRRVFIIAACLVPSILSAALLIARFQSIHQSDVQRDALLTARTLSQTVDRELKTCLSVAQALARSTHLKTGDLAAFDEQARIFLRDEFPGFNFVLVNGDSVQIVNTIRPLGAPLPDPGSKTINDSLGHAGGDAVLVEFSRRLLASVRTTDTVARLAGDEFVVILENLSSREVVSLVADKVMAQLSKLLYYVEEKGFKVTTSLGIAYLPPHGSVTPADLLARADTALYAAKANGRNEYRFDEQAAPLLLARPEDSPITC